MATYYTETKNRLADAFWRLALKRDIESITITQICREAKTGRRSFYRHFEGKRKIIEYGIRKKMEGITFCSPESDSLKDMVIRSFQFFEKEKALLRMVQKNGLSAIFQKMIMADQLFDKELEIYMKRIKVPETLREYVANSIAAIHTTLLLTWADHDYAENWEDLAKYELRLFSEML